MSENRNPNDLPQDWFNPDFHSKIDYYHPETGELVEALFEKSIAENDAAARAREAHPERVQLFLDERRAEVRAAVDALGGTLWDMALSDGETWSSKELADAGVAPSAEAAEMFFTGFRDGTPGLDFSGAGAGFMERARKSMPDIPREPPGRFSREQMAKRALKSEDVVEGHYLSGYLTRVELEDRASRQPGSLGYAWRAAIEAADGDVAKAARRAPAVTPAALDRFVGHTFSNGAVAGIATPRRDDAAMRRVVGGLRNGESLPRDVRVDLAAADGALVAGRSDAGKLFAAFVGVGEALRPLERDPFVLNEPEGSAAFAAGYATGQAIARGASLDKDLILLSEGIQVH